MFITVDDAKIFSVAFGAPTASAILGIGGWIGSWELWAGPFAQLSEDWRTIAYDHRGAGATVVPVESITFNRLVEDVAVVMDAHGVARAALAAESAGALVALGAALRYPKRITALVLVNGYYHNDTPEEADPFLAGLRSSYPQTLDAFVQACVPEAGCEHIKRWGRQILDRSSPDAAIALYRLTRTVDLRPQLHQVAQPALLLHGDADRLVPLESSRWLAQTLPHARLVVLPGAGHVPSMTRPLDVAREMAGFLREQQLS